MNPDTCYLKLTSQSGGPVLIRFSKITHIVPANQSAGSRVWFDNGQNTVVTETPMEIDEAIIGFLTPAKRHKFEM